MKQEIFNQADMNVEEDEMLPEYDFSKMSGGVQGKYHQAYREGHTVKIYNTDGTTTVQYFTLEEGAVMLEPDVQAYFPDSESVNHALRCLIPLLSKQDKKEVAT